MEEWAQEISLREKRQPYDLNINEESIPCFIAQGTDLYWYAWTSPVLWSWGKTPEEAKKTLEQKIAKQRKSSNTLM